MSANKTYNKIPMSTTSGVIDYFKGVKSEWSKVTWPERQQVVIETIFVIAIVFVFTIFIYGVDKVFDFVLSKLH